MTDTIPPEADFAINHGDNTTDRLRRRIKETCNAD